MPSVTQGRKRLVLVGAGHTHLVLLRKWTQRPIENAALTLISKFDVATYSGMLPGVLAGQYELAEAQVSLPELAEACGAELLIEPATGLNADGRFVELQSGRRVEFDVASVGIGSVPAGGELWREVPGVVAVKPITTLPERFDQAVEVARGLNAQTNPSQPLSVTVIGAGAAGVELALCLQRRLDRLDIGAAILLADGGQRILAGYRSKTRALAQREFVQRGILTRLGDRVVDVRPYRNVEHSGVNVEHAGVEVEFASGDTIVPHVVVWSTSAAPPPALDGFDLPKSDDGFLEVKTTLQSTSGAPIFAVGDTATFEKQSVPKAGVYAVREGPVLYRNLRRHLAGLPLVEYNPQKGFLSLLNTGDGRALLEYGPCSLHNGWAWRLKDRIDRRFVGKHRPT